jgi:hypothetical protein
MSSCQQDSYYTTIQHASGNACGACGGLYGGTAGTGWCGCGSCGQPPCCPAGTNFVGSQSGCGNAQCKWDCLPPVPSMDYTAKINCCSSTNLPGNTPNGYCASGWCPTSDNCASFMTLYCTGNNLQSNECRQFCKKNPGKCDQALISYCADPKNFSVPACGCAMPNSQYPIIQALTPEGLGVPITCDQRCGINNDAIRLINQQQDCTIGTICVANLSDVNVIGSQLQKGITINQNCGNVKPSPAAPSNPSNPPGSNGFYQKIKDYISTTNGKIILGVIIIIIIIFIGLIIWSLSGKHKSNKSNAE